MPERVIFRQSAITAYKRGIEKDIVPHLISWPAIVCLWLLLGLFIAIGFLAWFVQVPVYADGTGIILAEGDAFQPGVGETAAVVFLAPDQVAAVRPGLPADIEVGSKGTHVRGVIAKVVPGIISPEAARRSYRLDGAGGPSIAEPLVVVIVELDAALPIASYAGSIVTAKVEVGSQRLLAMLPGLGKFVGSSW